MSTTSTQRYTSSTPFFTSLAQRFERDLDSAIPLTKSEQPDYTAMISAINQADKSREAREILLNLVNAIARYDFTNKVAAPLDLLKQLSEIKPLNDTLYCLPGYGKARFYYTTNSPPVGNKSITINLEESTGASLEKSLYQEEITGDDKVGEAENILGSMGIQPRAAYQ